MYHLGKYNEWREINVSVLEETTVWGKMLVKCVCVAFLMLRALHMLSVGKDKCVHSSPTLHTMLTVSEESLLSAWSKMLC